MSDARLIWCVAATQLVGWGTLFIPFALLLAPMEAALDLPRAAVAGAFTLGLLVSGVAAVPVGRFVDRYGGRGPIAWGGLVGAALLLAWSQVDGLVGLYCVWFGLGLVHALALWGPAMALMMAAARQPVRSITALTFITGFTGTVFVPLIAWLVEAFGWRGALVALAVLLALPVPLALWGLPRTRSGVQSAVAVALGPVLRKPAFIGLAVCLAAHAFIGVGLAAHLLLLLRERGIAEGWVLTLVALHGPFQVAARALLYALGNRVRVLHVGVFAAALLPVGLAWLALGGADPWLLLGFVLCWAMADGLMTIVRAAAPAELLGREGYGAITGALSATAVLPRALAPSLLALLWQWGGGYGLVAPLLALVGVVALAAFVLAVPDQRLPAPT